MIEMKKIINIIETINLQYNKFTILTGRPNIGKTASVLKFAKDLVLKDNKNVIVFDLKESSQKCIDMIKDGQLTSEEIERLATHLIIDDTINISINEVKEKCINSNNVGCVIIDYIQLMKDFEIQKSYNKLKSLSLELHIPILAISTLNPQVSKNPTLIADLKIDSMDKSDVIIYMYKPTEGFKPPIKTPDNSKTCNMTSFLINVQHIRNKGGEAEK